MWIVAFVTVLIGHSLFPDEIDFCVLMVLPLSRAAVGSRPPPTVVLVAALLAHMFLIGLPAALAARAAAPPAGSPAD